jgi:hypothetical protein
LNSSGFDVVATTDQKFAADFDQALLEYRVDSVEVRIAWVDRANIYPAVINRYIVVVDLAMQAFLESCPILSIELDWRQLHRSVDQTEAQRQDQDDLHDRRWSDGS